MKFLSSNNREPLHVFLCCFVYHIESCFSPNRNLLSKICILNYLIRSLFSVTFILQRVDAYFSDDLSLKLCQNVLKCCWNCKQTHNTHRANYGCHLFIFTKPFFFLLRPWHCLLMISFKIIRMTKSYPSISIVEDGKTIQLFIDLFLCPGVWNMTCFDKEAIVKWI